MLPDRKDLLRKADPEISKHLKIFLNLGLSIFFSVVLILGMSFMIYFKFFPKEYILVLGFFLSFVIGAFLSIKFLKRFYESDK